jgi:signal transduction histidine kinase
MRQNKLFGKTRTSLALWYAGVMGLILSLLGVGAYKAIDRAYTLLLHTENHQDWGYLQVGQSLQDYEDFLTRAKKVLAVGLPISLLLIGGASWWLAGLAMRPIYQSYQQMEQFSADVAHELRTPLATVQTTVESALLLSKLESKKALSVLRTVERQNRRLIQLVVDLLLLAGMDKRSTLLHRESCCLNDLIQDLVEELLSMAIASRVTLSCDLRVNNSLYVLGDCDRLYRLVYNLIVNAIQHTSADGKVTVILKRNNNYALIQVWDTGVGIAPQHQKHIFDRFYRVQSDRSRSTGGSGLGLAIAQAIARSHNASLTVKSELGKGSIFTVQLPLVESKETA